MTLIGMSRYAQSHLSVHKKGLFRKNVSIRDMLSWNKDAIRKPMLPLDDKQLKKEACDIFKLVQVRSRSKAWKLVSTMTMIFQMNYPAFSFLTSNL